MENMTIEYHGDTRSMYTVGWKDDSARYHVWLDSCGVPQNKIYKNPHIDVTMRLDSGRINPAWFHTRELKLTANKWTAIREAIADIIPAMLELAALAYEQKELARDATAKELATKADLTQLHKLAARHGYHVHKVRTECHYVTLPSDDGPQTGLAFYDAAQGTPTRWEDTAHIHDGGDYGEGTRWELILGNYCHTTNDLHDLYTTLREWANTEHGLTMPRDSKELVPAYLYEFKDYDNCELFESLITELAPLGFEDSSWHNDTCPCLLIPTDDLPLMSLHVDYRARERREYPEIIATFHLQWSFEESNTPQCRDFVNRGEMLEFIKTKLESE